MYVCLYVQYVWFLSVFDENGISAQVLKSTHRSNLIKICPAGAELFLADERADMTKLTGVFRNFSNIPKNITFV